MAKKAKTPQTPQAWWNATKNNEAKFGDWLVKQYRGEVTAAVRIVQLGEKFDVTPTSKRILNMIAEQERTHAEWIKALLVSRGIEVPVVEQEQAEQRYWAATLPGIESFATGTAVAAHAEEMRLARIRVIADDESAPADVRSTFKRILKDEEWHASAFKALSTDTALAATLNAHEAGMEALGLSI
jgi:rubrerythrin